MKWRASISAGAATALSLAACVSVPTPDSRADELLTSILSSTAKIYAAIESGEAGACSHDANAAEWKSLDIQSKLLTLRFKVLPNSDNELAVAKALKDTIATAEASDRAALGKPGKCQNPIAAGLDEDAIESGAIGLQRLELQKGKK